MLTVPPPGWEIKCVHFREPCWYSSMQYPTYGQYSVGMSYTQGVWVSKAIFCIIAYIMYIWYTNMHLGCSQVYNSLYKHGLTSLKRSLMKFYMSAQMIFLTLM